MDVRTLGAGSSVQEATQDWNWKRGYARHPWRLRGWHLLLFFALMYFGWQALANLLGHTRFARNQLDGEWVGLIEVQEHQAVMGVGKMLSLRRAAVRYFVEPTDAFLGEYGCEGQITFAGEAGRHYTRINLINFDSIQVGDRMVKQLKGNFTRACIHLGTQVDPEGKQLHEVTCGIHGTFYPGAITLTGESGSMMEERTFRGVLHRGSDADYEALVRLLPVAH